MFTFCKTRARFRRMNRYFAGFGIDCCSEVDSLEVNGSQRPMTKFDRLEDVTPRWRAYFSDNLAGVEEEQVRRGVEAVLPERVNVGDPVQVDRITAAVGENRRRRVRESVMPACLGWLRENGFWAGGEDRENRALNEIAGALDGLTPFEPRLPVPVATVKNLAWVIPAAAGAAIGAAALGLLSHLLFDSRPIGLFAGGILGCRGTGRAGRRAWPRGRTSRAGWKRG